MILKFIVFVFICFSSFAMEDVKNKKSKVEAPEKKLKPSVGQDDSSEESVRGSLRKHGQEFDKIERLIGSQIFRSKNYRIFREDSQSATISENTNKSSDRELTHQEIKEFLRQKLDDAILNNDLSGQLLVIREIELYDREIANKDRVNKFRGILQKDLNKHHFKSCISNTSIAVGAILIIVIANIILKFC